VAERSFYRPFACWDPETRDEADALTFHEFEPARAAERYASDRYEADDNPERRTVHVRDDAGVVHVFSVLAVPSVDFRATPEKVEAARAR